MHFVKWLRKNNRKVMAFVVIFCMISFVLGQGVRYIVDSFFNQANQVIATYDDGEKIKSKDLINAQNELQILRMLMADQLLMAQGNQGLAGPLLTYLLFPDSQLASDLPRQLNQAVRQGQLNIDPKDIDAFFNQPPERAETLWLLLKKEAYRAGCILPTESARQTLVYAVPKMTNNKANADALLYQVVTKSNITEDKILRIFADLLGTLTYTNMVMNNESVTLNQTKAAVGRIQEKINADYVEIPADWFINDEASVSDTRIAEQFQTYKNIAPGTITGDNPFGFGYKLPKRITMDYILLSMDDVKKQIDTPTMDECEAYYDNNLNQFKSQVLSDPNDKESEKISVTRSYPEVATMIRRQLENQKTTTLANQIFNEIKTTLESGFETLNIDEATTEQLQQAAGDYQKLKAIADKFNVPIKSGKTGWLTPESITQVDVLNSLSMQRGQQTLRLSELAFAATKEKEKTPQHRVGIPSMRVWQNIGPLNGGFYSEQTKQYVRVMAMVRVTDIQPAQVAESVDVSYETNGVTMSDTESEGSVFSLKESVKDDIVLLDAMKQAKIQADQLAQSIEGTNWDQAVKAYNSKHAPADPNNPGPDDHVIKVASIKEKGRIPQSEIQKYQRFMAENPSSAQYIQARLADNLLTNALYELLEEDQKSTGTIHTVMPFQPRGVYLVVKDVMRVPATMEDYLSKKSQMALQLNAEESEPVILTYLSPTNLKERMNYHSKRDKTASQETDDTDAETPGEKTEK